MHWIVYAELRKYVDTRLGGDAWDHLLEASGLSGQSFRPHESHPDQRLLDLVAAASVATGTAAAAIVEDFGEFIAPDLLRLYRNLVKPEWRTLDLITNTEATIHTVVRTKEPAAHPPALCCERPRPDQVILTYSSPRRLCALAKGIVKGVAKHYQERVSIEEPSCMGTGARECRLKISTLR